MSKQTDLINIPDAITVSGSNVGIGTSSPSVPLHVNTSGTSMARFVGGNDGNLYITNDSANVVTLQAAGGDALSFNTNGGNERMRIDSSGNVGIGTQSPSALLEVASGAPTITLNADGQATNKKKVRLAASQYTAGDFNIQQMNDDGTTIALTAMTIKNGGNVGIGTSSPTSLLQVQGNGVTIKLDGTANTSRQINLRNTGTAEGQIQTDGNMHFIQEDANKYMRFSTANTERLRIDAEGRVGINTTADYSGVVNIANRLGDYCIGLTDTESNTAFIIFRNSADTAIGSILRSGTSAVAYNTSSDQRLKENIEDADDAGSKIDAIQVRKFDWKADGSHQDYGMVAQELQAVAPEAVSAPEDPEEMMGVDYSKLVPMMLKEIQSLRARINALEAE